MPDILEPGSGLPPEVDTTRPHTARMYDYFLGGKNHFAADRELADKVLATTPSARTAARENRAFLGRAVRFLAAEAGIRQFLDIGTGLPTTNSVHTTAEHDPEQWAPLQRAYESGGIPGQFRDSGEFARLAFAGLELVPPGVVLVSEWRPDTTGPRPTPAEVSVYGGVARKN